MEIEIREMNNIVIFDFIGDLRRGDFGAVTPLRYVKRWLRKGKRNFLFNLEEVYFMDSWGSGELLTCYVAILNLGGKLKVLNVQRLRIIFKVVLLDKVFEIYDDEDEAINSFKNNKASH